MCPLLGQPLAGFLFCVREGRARGLAAHEQLGPAQHVEDRSHGEAGTKERHGLVLNGVGVLAHAPARLRREARAQPEVAEQIEGLLARPDLLHAGVRRLLLLDVHLAAEGDLHKVWLLERERVRSETPFHGTAPLAGGRCRAQTLAQVEETLAQALFQAAECLDFTQVHANLDQRLGNHRADACHHAVRAQQPRGLHHLDEVIGRHRVHHLHAGDVDDDAAGLALDDAVQQPLGHLHRALRVHHADDGQREDVLPQLDDGRGQVADGHALPLDGGELLLQVPVAGGQTGQRLVVLLARGGQLAHEDVERLLQDGEVVLLLDGQRGDVRIKVAHGDHRQHVDDAADALGADDEGFGWGLERGGGHRCVAQGSGLEEGAAGRPSISSARRWMASRSEFMPEAPTTWMPSRSSPSSRPSAVSTPSSWMPMLCKVRATSAPMPESTVRVPMSRAELASRASTEHRWLSTNQRPEMSTTMPRAPVR
ncbi:hypothetical protein STIAU_3520 [Stigmatella aurantiaca DW4/3-1]|uniref:Uncharacterized protein n=1 Tax=Stigmatella aurantiaca (strain DW4/3-1) TaxID=378806 RepID=Q093W0_STIAD|nr:hypothetical protein STIAU_3520 [Stigmatella aurantiaca DW4/3-1]